MKKYKLVKVEWDDAYNIGKWQDHEELDDFLSSQLFRCVNVGWLVRKNKDAIVIAARMGDEGDQFGLAERLPRKMIKKITYLD